MEFNIDDYIEDLIADIKADGMHNAEVYEWYDDCVTLVFSTEPRGGVSFQLDVLFGTDTFGFSVAPIAFGYDEEDRFPARGDLSGDPEADADTVVDAAESFVGK